MGGNWLEKNTKILVAVAIALIFLTIFALALIQFSSNNTANDTTNLKESNKTSLTNTEFSNQTQNQSNNPPPPPTVISLEKAKDLAQKYAGPGTTLGKPVLTTYKKIKAWQVPVYTLDHRFINNIYIDSKTGDKVD